MISKTEPTFWVRIYLSGPIEIAKQTIRYAVLQEGLCVTIEPTLFIYTGGEEAGYVVGLVNYPRFPALPEVILARARELALQLLASGCQHSALVMSPTTTEWITKRPEEKVPPNTP